MEMSAMAQRAIDHGGCISYKAMPDGSRMPYELNINYLDALSNPAGNESPELAARKFLTAHAILLSLQGMPGIYFHSMFGSRGDREGAESSGIPRRINRQKLDYAALEQEIQAAHSLRGCVWNGLKNLLRVRRSLSAFHPQAAQEVLATDPRVFALWRILLDENGRVLCLQNVSPQNVQIGGLFQDVEAASIWTDAITGQCFQPGTAGSIELAGYQTLWLQPSRKA
jgi:sucrose phosphorylase